MPLHQPLPPGLIINPFARTLLRAGSQAVQRAALGLGTLATGSTVSALWSETFRFDKAPIVAVAGTLAPAAAAVTDPTDIDGHYVGADMGDNVDTWLHWEFVIPDNLHLTAGVFVMIGLRESNNNSNPYELSLVGQQLRDGGTSGSGVVIPGLGAFTKASAASAGQFRVIDSGIEENILSGLTLSPGDLISGSLKRDAIVTNLNDLYTGTLRVAYIKFQGTQIVTVS